MKELSIEEKAKRYDEAIERAKNHYSTTDSSSDIKLIGLIFPELKESGDEKIRQALIRFHKSTIDVDGIKGDEIVSWLEKQGNLMKALQISNANIGELVEKNYYLKEQLEKRGKNNMGISEATKQKLEDNLNKALEKETPESCNEFLDEQGKKKPVINMKTPEESLGIDSDTYSKIVDECVYGEQKPTDKVEPKFKVGDFIANDYCVGKVIALTDDAYLLGTGQGIPFSCEHNAHLWSIQDAKDGDVLYENDTETIFIFESQTCGWIKVYCDYWVSKDKFTGTDKADYGRLSEMKLTPATKEQRDLLFQKIKEAGYEWDSEKKELKKVEQKKDTYDKLTAFEFSLKHIIEEAIECGDIHNLKADADMLLRLVQKSSWSEEDDNTLLDTINILRSCGRCSTDRKLWLLSIKDRMQSQKQEWSDVDKDILFRTIDNLKFLRDTISKDPKYAVNIIDIEREITWLKSLRPQNTWKPSDEQIKAIKWIIDGDNPENWSITLKNFYQDLKKLREE